jgi:hypothetical protein
MNSARPAVQRQSARSAHSARTPLLSGLIAKGEDLLRALGSPRWMLAFFVFALMAAQVAIHRPAWLTAAWAVPLSLFATSLVAAITTNPRFRADAPLLVLHVGLLALVGLIAFSRLSYFDGATTLSQDEVFDGRLILAQRGPLHDDALQRLRFRHESVEEVFEASATRPAIFNRVRWWDAAGRSHLTTVTDGRPIEIDGYRIFTTFNRGYAPVMSWRDMSGNTDLGTVQLGAGADIAASNTLTLVDGTQVWLMLDAPALHPVQRGERRRDFGVAGLPHVLVVRSGDVRANLRIGESVRLGNGELTYLHLKTWMGYRIVHDVATHWLLAAIAVTLVGMIWFYASRGIAHRRGDD